MCAPYPFINPLSNRVERRRTVGGGWIKKEREKPRLFNQIMIRDAQTQDVFFVGITLCLYSPPAIYSYIHIGNGKIARVLVRKRERVRVSERVRGADRRK